jgi:hypothetical protein
VTRLWAVVNASGSIARSSGEVSSGRLNAGAYEVLFNRDVTNCAYVASVGDPAALTPSAGYALVARRSGNANGVRVDTRSGTATLSDRSFHLLVVC